MLDVNPLDDLPTRLEQVLHLLAAGKRNKEIAQDLGYSANTIRNYVSELLELSSCRSRTELAVRASERELMQRRQSEEFCTFPSANGCRHYLGRPC